MSKTGLDELRMRIDRIDETIVSALAARFALSSETGARKSGVIRDPERETVVLAHVEALAEELGLVPSYAAAMYDVILRLSVQDQLASSAGSRA